MSAMSQGASNRTVIAIICVACILTVLFLVLYVARLRSSPNLQSVLSRVAIGSSIEELNSIARMRNVRSGDIMQWLPTNRFPDRSDIQLRQDGVIIRNEFGVFLQKNVGMFSERASNMLPSQFTGEVVFFLDRSFSDGVVLGFTYIDGKLVKKDWGYLPG